MRNKKRLTEAEFMRLNAELGEVRNQQAQRLAYAALVEGRPLVEIGREFGVTSAWVMQCRNEWWEAHLRLNHFPPGWVKATLIAPENRLQEFLAEIEAMRREHYESSRGK